MKPTRSVVIVAFPGLQSLDAVGPFEVFAGATRAARSLGPARRLRRLLVSTGGQTGPGRERAGPVHRAAARPRRPDRHPGPARRGQAQAARRDAALMAWIRAVAPRCRRVATVCTGAFLAAEAGLLDGRRVTTHWARAEQLAAEFPALDVDPDPIYIRDGKFWTSAGVTAGIDLALALVQDDLGIEVAQTVARWLVMFLHRPGGQTQFASPVWVPRAERSTVRAVQTLVEAAPGRRPPPPRPGGRRGHERAPLRPGVHRRGGRDPRALRRARAPGGGPARAGDHRRHPRRRRRRAAASARPRRCDGSSNDD